MVTLPNPDDADLPDAPYTDDTLLSGRVHIRQSRHGYRAAIDPVLLAAAVPSPRVGQRVLDLGCGPGAALLCYLNRAPGDTGTGIEVDPEAAELALHNVGKNGLTDRCRIIQGDIAHLDSLIEPESMDQVFANPPYLNPHSADSPPHPDKRRSHVEGSQNLIDWLGAMVMAARPKGGLTVIHRAERLQEILAFLQGQAGETEVIPLWPRIGVPAKRVIVRARKGVRGGTKVLPGLVLHGSGNGYSEEADAVLTGGNALL